MCPQVCVGCLSTDRKLGVLGQNFRLFRNIIEQISPKAVEEPDKLSTDAEFCWECRQNVVNIQKFVTKVTRSQKILKRFSGTKLSIFKSFSSLKQVNPDEKKIKDEVIVLEDVFVEIPSIDNSALKIESKPNTHENTFVDIPNDDDDDWLPDDHDDGWDKEDDEPIKPIKKEIKTENHIEIKKESVPLSILTHLKDVVVKKAGSKPKLDITEVKVSNSESVKLPVLSLNRPVFDAKKRKICTRIPIGDQERAMLMRSEKMSEEYKSYRWKCRSCVIGFAREITYMKHLKLFHNASYYHVCDICASRFNSTSSLKVHKETHYYKYQCNFCNRSERQQTQIYRHYELTHYGKKRKELKANRSTNAKQPVVLKKLSTADIKRVECHECGDKFHSKTSLGRHIALRHGTRECSYCTKLFTSRDTLQAHLKEAHENAYKEQCYCVECDHQFGSLEAYRKHLKKSLKHNPDRIKDFTCEDCNITYQYDNSLKLHRRIRHAAESHPFQCDSCDKSFPFKSRLQCHIENIHNTKKQPKPKDKLCPHCGRGFTRYCHLTHHIRTHTGEKPFYCVICRNTFNQKTTLVSHYKSTHKVSLTYKQIKGYGEVTIDLGKTFDIGM